MMDSIFTIIFSTESADPLDARIEDIDVGETDGDDPLPGGSQCVVA